MSFIKETIDLLTMKLSKEQGFDSENSACD